MHGEHWQSGFVKDLVNDIRRVPSDDFANSANHNPGHQLRDLAPENLRDGLEWPPEIKRVMSVDWAPIAVRLIQINDKP
jgi:hypothetical protein